MLIWKSKEYSNNASYVFGKYGNYLCIQMNDRDILDLFLLGLRNVAFVHYKTTIKKCAVTGQYFGNTDEIYTKVCAYLEDHSDVELAFDAPKIANDNLVITFKEKYE